MTEIPIGEQGIAFDRLDLNAWVNQYKSRNGRPGQPIGDKRTPSLYKREGIWHIDKQIHGQSTGTDKL